MKKKLVIGLFALVFLLSGFSGIVFGNEYGVDTNVYYLNFDEFDLSDTSFDVDGFEIGDFPYNCSMEYYNNSNPASGLVYNIDGYNPGVNNINRSIVNFTYPDDQIMYRFAMDIDLSYSDGIFGFNWTNSSSELSLVDVEVSYFPNGTFCVVLADWDNSTHEFVVYYEDYDVSDLLTIGWTVEYGNVLTYFISYNGTTETAVIDFDDDFVDSGFRVDNIVVNFGGEGYGWSNANITMRINDMYYECGESFYYNSRFTSGGGHRHSGDNIGFSDFSTKPISGEVELAEYGEDSLLSASPMIYDYSMHGIGSPGSYRNVISFDYDNPYPGDYLKSFDLVVWYMGDGGSWNPSIPTGWIAFSLSLPVVVDLKVSINGESCESFGHATGCERNYGSTTGLRLYWDDLDLDMSDATTIVFKVSFGPLMFPLVIPYCEESVYHDFDFDGDGVFKIGYSEDRDVVLCNRNIDIVTGARSGDPIYWLTFDDDYDPPADVEVYQEYVVSDGSHVSNGGVLGSCTLDFDIIAKDNPKNMLGYKLEQVDLSTMYKAGAYAYQRTKTVYISTLTSWSPGTYRFSVFDNQERIDLGLDTSDDLSVLSSYEFLSLFELYDAPDIVSGTEYLNWIFTNNIQNGNSFNYSFLNDTRVWVYEPNLDEYYLAGSYVGGSSGIRSDFAINSSWAEIWIYASNVSEWDSYHDDAEFYLSDVCFRGIVGGDFGISNIAFPDFMWIDGDFNYGVHVWGNTGGYSPIKLVYRSELFERSEVIEGDSDDFFLDLDIDQVEGYHEVYLSVGTFDVDGSVIWSPINDTKYIEEYVVANYDSNGDDIFDVWADDNDPVITTSMQLVKAHFYTGDASDCDGDGIPDIYDDTPGCDGDGVSDDSYGGISVDAWKGLIGVAICLIFLMIPMMLTRGSNIHLEPSVYALFGCIGIGISVLFGFIPTWFAFIFGLMCVAMIVYRLFNR